MTINVRQLREILKSADQDAEVHLASDEEGNSFNPLQAWGEDFDLETNDGIVILWP